jgi:hypothetical protein
MSASWPCRDDIPGVRNRAPWARQSLLGQGVERQTSGATGLYGQLECLVFVLDYWPKVSNPILK